MTSRERILCAMELKTPDRVPVSPFTLGRLDPQGEMAKRLIRETDPLIDVGIGGNIFLGQLVQAESLREGNDTVTVIHTPKGDLLRRYRRTEVTGYTVEFPCKNGEDVEKLLSIPFKPAEPNPGGFFRWKEMIGEEGLVLAGLPDAICFPASYLSPQDMCLLWMDEPKLMLKMVETAAERLNEFVERACKLGVDAFRIIGGEYATQQLGPKGFNALVKPFDRDLCRIIHRYGGIAYYHNHGDVNRFLEDFADLEIDALDPLEMPPYGDVDLADAKRRVGDKYCLVGPLDDMEVLETKDFDYISELAWKCLQAAGPDGYILGGTASGTYTERAAENFIRLVELSKRFSAELRG